MYHSCCGKSEFPQFQKIPVLKVSKSFLELFYALNSADGFLFLFENFQGIVYQEVMHSQELKICVRVLPDWTERNLG